MRSGRHPPNDEGSVLSQCPHVWLSPQVLRPLPNINLSMMRVSSQAHPMLPFLPSPRQKDDPIWAIGEKL